MIIPKRWRQHCQQDPSPKKRSNGIAARERILDAAAEIACERGYDGTSISLVSKRAGFPASSIYWHFENKDDLLAAVIERSFEAWMQEFTAFGPPAEDATLEQAVRHQVEQTAQSLKNAPDFLRLGLMLAMEKRPEEPTAKAMFLKVRADAYQNSITLYERLLPELSAQDIEHLASFGMAMADGLFVAQQAGDATVDMVDQYELQAAAVLGLIEQLRSKHDG